MRQWFKSSSGPIDSVPRCQDLVEQAAPKHQRLSVHTLLQRSDVVLKLPAVVRQLEQFDIHIRPRSCRTSQTVVAFPMC